MAQIYNRHIYVPTSRPVETLTPLTYEILVALADAPRHGYGIIKEIEARAGSGGGPSTGALYLALQRMEAQGLIGEAEEHTPGTDKRRRYWAMTRSGREAAKAESLRLASLVAAARAKDLLARGST
jgi:DNA-binding PadR family transcriptional regulator